MSHNLVFVARQAGSAAALLPVVKELENEYICEFFAYDKAYDILKKQNIESIKIKNFEEVKFQSKPDIIITGSSLQVIDDNKFWLYAKEISVPSVALIDSWASYWQRFTIGSYKHKWNCCPDTIAVIDDFMLKQCLAHGASRDNISITGNPAFESMAKAYRNYGHKGKNYSSRILLVMDPLLDLYGSDTIKKIGYTEFDFLNNILTEIETQNIKKSIEIRLHPRERINKYDNLLDQYKSLDITVTDYKTNKIDSLKHATLIVGMNSILLYEAGILGKNVWSYQVNAVDISDIVKNRSFINIVHNTEDIELALKSNNGKENNFNIENTFTELIKSNIYG